jgi:hypothetical protein
MTCDSGFGDLCGFAMFAALQENADEIAQHSRRQSASRVSCAKVLQAFVEPPLSDQQQRELLVG